jgi:Ca2+-binding RTX toxin-like protein
MNVEKLETRRCRSVTVTEGYPGFFEVWGDDSANTIAATVSMSAETFTMDGVTYHNVSYISVYGGGGDDTITLLATDGPGFIGTGVTAGSGNDSVTLNFDGAIWAGSGSDTLDLKDSFRGEAYGESGDDHVTVSGECVDPAILGGPGNDVIDATNNHYRVVIRGGCGDDLIFGSLYDDDIYGDEGSDILIGNDGDDTFYSQCGGADWVIGGSGMDTLYGTSVAGTDSVERFF